MNTDSGQDDWGGPFIGGGDEVERGKQSLRKVRGRSRSRNRQRDRGRTAVTLLQLKKKSFEQCNGQPEKREEWNKANQNPDIIRSAFEEKRAHVS